MLQRQNEQGYQICFVFKRTNCTENPLCSQFSLYSLQWLYWGEGRGCSKFLNEWPQASRECCLFHQTGILDKTIRSYYSSSLFGSFPATTEKNNVSSGSEEHVVKYRHIIAKIPCHFFHPFLKFAVRRSRYQGGDEWLSYSAFT